MQTGILLNIEISNREDGRGMVKMPSPSPIRWERESTTVVVVSSRPLSPALSPWDGEREQDSEPVGILPAGQARSSRASSVTIGRRKAK